MTPSGNLATWMAPKPNRIGVTLPKAVGRYTCAAENMSCRQGGADNSGNITAGSVSGNRINLAVKLPADRSDCYYSGATTSPAQANGIYVCYWGGRMIEEGVWTLARQAPEE